MVNAVPLVAGEPRRLTLAVSPTRSNEENALQLSIDITRLTSELSSLRERLDEAASLGRQDSIALVRIAESLAHLTEDVHEVRASQRLLESEALGKRVGRLESELEDLRREANKAAVKMAGGGAVVGTGAASLVQYLLSLFSGQPTF